MSLAELRELGTRVVLHFDFSDPNLTREAALTAFRTNSL